MNAVFSSLDEFKNVLPRLYSTIESNKRGFFAETVEEILGKGYTVFGPWKPTDHYVIEIIIVCDSDYYFDLLYLKWS